jgi:hypothetical protein
MVSNNKVVKSLLKTARWIHAGIFIQASLFALWGLSYFINPTENAPLVMWPALVFSILGLGSFAYGLRFFQNYTTLKKNEILAMEVKKRRESLLLVTVIHFLMIEFVCVLGIILAIFLQRPSAVYPFYVAFIGGMALSIPRDTWFSSFFPEEERSS